MSLFDGGLALRSRLARRARARARSRAALGWVACASLLACESYEPAPVVLKELGAELAKIEVPEELDLPRALRFAEVQDPELRRLAHEARAAGEDVPGFDLLLAIGTRDGMADLSVDPAALLSELQRGARIDVARAERASRVAEWLEARWRLGTELAGVFRALEALEELRAPRLDVAEAPFERAGLASPNSIARLRAARLAAEVEERELLAERERLLAKLARRLGVPRANAPRAVFGAELERDPELRAGADESVAIEVRPDLLFAEARYARAEAELAEAAMAQYPSLRIGPEWMIGSSSWGGMFQVSLPIDAGGPVRAARARREAARADLEATWLAAEEELRVLEQDLAVAEARVQMADAAHAAAELGVRTARAQLEVDAGAFEMYAERAAMWARETQERRMAHLARAGLAARFAARGGVVPGASNAVALATEEPR